MLAAVFLLQAHVRNIAAWHPVFVVVTFCVICCEKVGGPSPASGPCRRKVHGMRWPHRPVDCGPHSEPVTLHIRPCEPQRGPQDNAAPVRTKLTEPINSIPTLSAPAAQVDVTLNKGVLRMSGCVVGGVFGFLVMLPLRLASNPWGLTAILAAWSAACGAFVHSRLKYAAFLSQYTSSVMILAQVQQCGSPAAELQPATLRDCMLVMSLACGSTLSTGGDGVNELSCAFAAQQALRVGLSGPSLPSLRACPCFSVPRGPHWGP